MGSPKLGLELNDIAPSEDIDNLAESAPVRVNVGVSLSASVTVIVTTAVCPLETSILEGRSLITGALSFTLLTEIEMVSVEVDRAPSDATIAIVKILSPLASEGFS